MVVGVAVVDAAAVGDHGVVEEGAVAFRDLVEPAEQIGQLPRVEEVDEPELGLLGEIAAVVREVVMALGDLDEGVGLVAGLIGQHEGDDAGDIGLERHNDQVAHQADMLLVRGRDRLGAG